MSNSAAAVVLLALLAIGLFAAIITCVPALTVVGGLRACV